MRKYEDSVSSATTGLPVYLAEIHVQHPDTTPAQLYSDNGVTPLSQPALTDGLGLFSFYVADGTYTIIVADAGGVNPRTFTGIEIYEDARNVSVPLGEAGITLPSVGARANKVLAFDGAGLPVAADPEPGPAGPPGGNIMAIGLTTAIGASTISVGTNVIRTTGFRTLGKGAAHYTRASGLPSWGSGVWWFADASGAQWQISEPQPDLLMFGGYDDGAKAYNSSTVTGTDNAPAMNALLYYCQFYGYSTAYIPAGKYSFYDTVHVGFGGGNLGAYSHVNIKGVGPMYAGHQTVSGFPGVSCFAAFSDRPLFNIQGQRDCTIEGILFGGKFEQFVISNNCAVNNNTIGTLCPFDDREIGNWYDPALSASQDGRYTPYAAITVDAFSGGGGMGGVGGSSRPTLTAWTVATAISAGYVRYAATKVYVCRIGGTTAGSGTGPSGTTSTEVDGTVTWAYMGPYDSTRPSQYVAYPDMTYPSYSGVSTQYGKGQSSKFTIKNCNFEGFVACVAVQPCNYDGNGDFLTVSDCLMQYCKYGITIGNTQSRNVHVSNITGQQIHTFLEGAAHGKNGARMQGPIVNVSLSNIMQLFNGSGAGIAPLDFYDCYIECLDRIGNLAGGNGGCVSFHGGGLYIAALTYNNARGIPDNHYSGSSTRQYYNSVNASAPLYFYGTALNFSGVLTLMGQEIVMLGGSTRDEDIQGNAPLYYCLAHNALSGCVVTPDFGSRPGITGAARIESQFRGRNVVTGDQGGSGGQTNGVVASATRLTGSSFYARKLSTGSLSAPVDVERPYRTVPKSQFPDLALSGLVLTGTYASAANQADYYNLLPGDVLQDDQTGKVFFVFSFDTGTKVMKAVLRNGYKGAAGAETLYGSFSTTVGNFSTCTGRVYTPTLPLFITSSPNQTFTADTNTSVLLTNFVGASDLLIGRKITGTGIPTGTYVIAVDGTTVLLSQAATATATGITMTVGTAGTTVGGSANTTTGSRSLTGITGGPLIPGATVSGTGIPTGNYIQSVSGTTAVMGNPAGNTAAQATATAFVALTMSSGTRILSNVTDQSGASSMTGILGVGDFLTNDMAADNIVDGGIGVSVVAFDDTARTITLSNSALWPPVTGRRLRALRMAPPANVATP
jgi:hypothetical protein